VRAVSSPIFISVSFGRNRVNYRRFVLFLRALWPFGGSPQGFISYAVVNEYRNAFDIGILLDIVIHTRTNIFR